jgi:hypothetical protein
VRRNIQRHSAGKQGLFRDSLGAENAENGQRLDYDLRGGATFADSLAEAFACHGARRFGPRRALIRCGDVRSANGKAPHVVHHGAFGVLLVRALYTWLASLVARNSTIVAASSVAS